MYLAMLRKNTYVKGAAYGDLPFHLNIISSFAWGANNRRESLYDVKSVFYMKTRLAYPFIPNFLSAALIATGKATLRASLIFPSILMSFSLVIGIYLVSFIFTKNHLMALLSLILFCNLGGLGWLYAFDMSRDHMDFVHDWGKSQNEYWFHPIFHVIVPQRASLFSMPLCYWCLICLLNGIQKKQWQFFLLAAFYVGFTPLVQIHSYVGLAQWSICYAAITFPWNKRSKWPKYIFYWAIFGIVANVMALPQIPPYLGRLEANRKEFIQLNPIWSNKFSQFNIFAPVVCWWRGLGIFGAIALVCGWVTLKRSQLIMYAPSMIVWLITNIIRYQPWELDNTKVFYAVWIPLALCVVSQFYVILMRYPKLIPLVSILLFSSCLSAGIHTVDCLVSTSQIYFDNDFEFGEWIAENIPVKAMTISSDAHNHPVSNIAGRFMFEGYGGWVASHGLEWFEHESERRTLTENPDLTQDFIDNNISYMLALNREYKEFTKINDSETWLKVYEDPIHEVWRFVPPINKKELEIPENIKTDVEKIRRSTFK
ncbi:hypothetical protein TVAG_263830 [Trichomonas vaginalis G3]|uniref:Uncharacterized protein n=1 Tax=Trichomonas vaginalis (strain ATCC PRA-98 / G3) TaxID=412133 RepID=A2EP09_TRIV3|nr:hypothetical protein TVAGG3_0945590 [Trichomonas vaginalis G3]EAY05613.1 hypothetical protein TVAG_263830 [Trichomonas vaginalis G3]KAI5486853.1 hypothetical protein TVAGG3_0945590 [Trichomonas vaginalis G3]|eukprot:XP_001317836.1 hypothetical protein [Trichomonas vaginalis G3]